MAKLVWRVKLVTELQAGETTEVELARVKRDEQAGLSDLGLCLAEAKQLTSALQAEIIPARVAIAGEHRLHLRGLRASAVKQGTLHRDIPLAVR